MCVCLDLPSLPGHINVFCLIRVTWENQIKLRRSQNKYLNLKKGQNISRKIMISLLFLSKPSFHSALYMQCLSKVQSQCFFTQNVLQFIHREKHIYFLLHSTSVRTDKTATRRLLLFSFVTGKHRAACYQVKQDKLKKASGG